MADITIKTKVPDFPYAGLLLLLSVLETYEGEDKEINYDNFVENVLRGEHYYNKKETLCALIGGTPSKVLDNVFIWGKDYVKGSTLEWSRLWSYLNINYVYSELVIIDNCKLPDLDISKIPPKLRKAKHIKDALRIIEVFKKI